MFYGFDTHKTLKFELIVTKLSRTRGLLTLTLLISKTKLLIVSKHLGLLYLFVIQMVDPMVNIIVYSYLFVKRMAEPNVLHYFFILKIKTCIPNYNVSYVNYKIRNTIKIHDNFIKF